MSARIAFFDMDHTLIGADCDVTWKEFAVAHGLADASALEEAARFTAAYDAGTLVVEDFLRFQWKEFSGRTVEEVESLCRKHFEEKVRRFCRSAALDEVKKCRDSNMTVWVLTSTCRFLAAPVAQYFGADALFAPEIEIRQGLVSDRLQGLYPCGEGKVEAMLQIAGKVGATPAECRAYGDSINDLPLLAAVGESFAVNPSAALKAEAEKRHWHILDWEKRK
ncbi:MAG: HAD-IB family hydrolase [Clostridia bacterium]|nr:HAD-IB family hydrolase [Clostridia bacterium]